MKKLGGGGVAHDPINDMCRECNGNILAIPYPIHPKVRKLKIFLPKTQGSMEKVSDNVEPVILPKFKFNPFPKDHSIFCWSKSPPQFST